jgi:hypothetical protein
MRRNDGEIPDPSAQATAPAGDYLIPEFHFRTLEGMRDDLILLATLASCADRNGMPMGCP